MVLSLTLINVPPPTEYESSAYMRQERPLITFSGHSVSTD